MTREPLRYELVSRRALLKGGSAGLGLVIAAAACGTDDVDVFAGALTELVNDDAAGTAAQPIPTLSLIHI